jgi:predicted lipoprotein with Yx(FWY)xxD motif
MRTHPRLGILLILALGAVLAACSGGGATASPAASEAPPTVAPPSEAPASVPPASEAPPSEAPPAGGETVAVADSTLGQILVDGEGRTLYLFTNDTAGESVCYDDCATNWPPLLADGEITVGAGLDASLFTTVARTDGTMQVKIGDWPLYYFAADQAAGDTNGQGVGDVWYVVSPTGEQVE